MTEQRAVRRYTADENYSELIEDGAVWMRATDYDALSTELAEAKAEIERMREREESMNASLNERIEAYPLDLFPEPDFQQVATALKAAGLSIDRVSASNFRWMVKSIKRSFDALIPAKGKGE